MYHIFWNWFMSKAFTHYLTIKYIINNFETSNIASNLRTNEFLLRKSLSVKWFDSEISSDILLEYCPIFSNAIFGGSSKILWIIKDAIKAYFY